MDCTFYIYFFILYLIHRYNNIINTLVEDVYLCIQIIDNLLGIDFGDVTSTDPK